MPEIVITRRMHKFVSDTLGRDYSVWQNPSNSPITNVQLKKRIKNCKGLLCLPYDTVDSDVIDAAPDLRTISTFSVGYDHIDIPYARRKNITIGHTPDVLSEATANMSLALMLDVTRGISHGDRMIRGGKWKAPFAPMHMCGMDLRGKVLGILGMGRIGLLFAKQAAALGMKISYHSRHRISPRLEKSIGAKYVTMNRLLRECDVLSVHVPHTAKTHHMIDSKALQMMRPESYLINTSRGAVIEEKSLAYALKSGQIRAAGLDVFESEPIGAKNPLLRMDNVTLVPHLGSATEQTRDGMAHMALENISAGLCGKKIPYEVPASR